MSAKEVFSRAKSFDDLLKMLSEEEAGQVPELLWKRCALVPEFDPQLYQRLAQGIEAPDFESFVRLAQVQPVSESRQGYCLRPDAQRRYLDLWRPEDEQLRSSSKTLAEYYQQRRNPVEALRQLVIAEPEAALERFDELYREADSRFDMSRCDALLRALRDRYSMLARPLQEALNERERYYKSRAIFADDYYGTLVYLQRRRLLTAFKKFLSSSQAWVLNIHGKGGMGKTTFIRWAIAHYCIPESAKERTPVARVDMDAVDLPLLQEQPWLMLLLVALQLDPQLSGFAELTGRQEQSLAQLVRRSAAALPEEERQTLIEAGVPSREKIELLFQDGLGNRRVVVIFDTVEELLLHYPVTCVSLLELLSRIQSRCPGLKVVWSGRYQLLDRQRPQPLELTDKFRASLKKALRTAKVNEFDEDQRRQYLRKLRDLKRPKPIIDAMAVKSDGNPFLLSLLADLSPTLNTVQEVKDCPVEFAYLIERVIDRIPDEDETPHDSPEVLREKRSNRAVRWLLRYAVIPRRLTREFLEAVLIDFLVDEISGKTQLDDTSLSELGDRYRMERWRRIRADLDAARLWNELLNYASGNSWIERDEDALVLQSEVVVPMRELLRQNSQKYPIYFKLHQAAADFFRKREADHEALYHHHQREGSKAARHWRPALDRCRKKGHAARRVLAESLLGQDYVDDAGEPLDHFLTGKIIQPELLAEAAFESAMATMLELLGKSDRLDRKDLAPVRPRLRNCRRWAQNKPEQVVSQIRWDLVEAALDVAENKMERASEKLPLEAVEALQRPEERIAGLLLRAAAVGEERLALHKKALETAERHSDVAHPQYFLLEQMGHANLAEGRLDESWNCFERALKAARESDANPKKLGELLVHLLDVAQVTGRATRLGELAEEIRPVKKFPAHEQAMTILIKQALDCLDLEKAALRLSQLNTKVAGVRLEMEAEHAAARCRFDEARRLYDKAELDYRKRSYFSSETGVVLLRARFLLDQVGDPRRSLKALDALQSSRRFPEPVVGFEFFLLRLRQWAAVGEVEDGRRLFDDFLKYVEDQPALSEAHRLLGLATLLVEGLGAEEQWEEFAQAWAKLQPKSCRVAVLRPFLVAGSHQAANPEDFCLKGIDRLDAGGELPESLYLIAARRACGRPVQKSLEALLKRHGERPELLRCFKTLGWKGPWLTDLPQLQELAEREPCLAGAMLLEESARALAMDEVERGQSIFRAARDYWGENLTRYSKWNRLAVELQLGIDISLGKNSEANKTLSRLRSLAEEAADGRTLQRLRKQELAEAETQTTKSRWKYESYTRVEYKSWRTEIAEPSVSAPLLTPAELLEFSLGEEFNVTHTSVERKVENRIHSNRLIQSLADNPTEALAPYGLIHLLRELGPEAARRELAEILEPAYRRPDNLWALQMEMPVLWAVPWELGMPEKARVFRCSPQTAPPRETVRWIQQMLDLPVDGIHSPALQEKWDALGDSPRDALYSRLQKRGGEMRVVLLRGDLEEARSTGTGHGSAGVRAEWIYKEHGVSAGQPDPHPEALRQMVLELRPSVLHVIGILQEEERVGDITLQIAGRESAYGRFDEQSKSPWAQTEMVEGIADRQITFSARQLEDILQSLPEDVVRPTVILEAAYSASPVRQLALRNLFAARLAEGPGVRGVLAVGPYPPEILSKYLEILALGIRGSETLAAVHSLLRRQQHIGIYAPALFAQDPELPVSS